LFATELLIATKGPQTMNQRRIADWTLLPGATVEMRQQGTTICRGLVDAVTDDGTILWLQPRAGYRRLFEKAEFHEAWADEVRIGFHYEVSSG
jgi:hypothetical protein